MKKNMKTMNSNILKKMLSILCVVLMVSVVFSTVVKNVTADEDECEEEISVVSLNPDVATNDYIHMVWQENVTDENTTQYEVMYVNNMSKNFENTLISAISTVEMLIVENDDYEDVLNALDKALEEYNEKDFKHSIDKVHHAVKSLEKIDNTGLIHTLVDAVRDFAKTNILYAETILTFNNTYIQEAYQRYYLAIKKYDEKNYDASIEQFKNSYLKIVEAYEENNTIFVGIDFGEIVRVSYTDFDSVNAAIYLNGTISVGWIEMLPEGNHTYYARSTNGGTTWWYFDATKYGSTYFTYIGLPLPPSPPSILPILDGIIILRNCHHFYIVVVQEGEEPPSYLPVPPITDGPIAAPIDDPTFYKYASHYDVTSFGDMTIYIVCTDGGGGGGGPSDAPDLTVTNLSFSRRYLIEGETVTINATVRNLGDASVSGAEAAFYYDNSILISTVSDINLSPSESTPISAQWCVQPGGHKITVVADPSDGLEEGVEDNNMVKGYLEALSKFSSSVSGTYEGAITTSPIQTSDPIVSVTALWNDDFSTEGGTTSSKAVDTTPPTISITAPATAIVSGTVLVTTSATDTFGIDYVKFYIDGTYKSTDNYKPYEYTWETDTPTVSDGDHIIKATAYDNNGNSASDTKTVTVDNNPPEISSITPSGWKNGWNHVTAYITDATNVDWAFAWITKTPDPTLQNIKDNGVSIPSPGGNGIGTWSISYTPSDVPGGVTEGDTYYVWIATGDGRGNPTKEKTTVNLDQTPPVSPSITINGDAYTNSRTVTLSLSADDPLSGLSQMCFSNDGSSWTWYSWATPHSWTLTSGDGTKTVYFRARDHAGNEVAIANKASDTIVLDQTPPNNPTYCTVSPSVSSDVWQNTVYDVSFTWSGYSDALSDVNGFYYYWGLNQDGTSSSYKTTPGYDPSPVSDGIYYLRVKTKDNAGNTASWKTMFILKYDNTPPGLLSIKINNDEEYTSSQDVTLTLYAEDVGLDQMMISNDETFAGASWESYSISKTWAVTPGDGAKTIYFKVKDYMGFVTGHISDTIILDMTLPEPPSPSADPSGWTSDTTPTISWNTVPDPGSGISCYKYQIDSTGGIWTSVGIATSFDTPSLSDGVHTIYVKAIDGAGNAGSWGYVNVYIDTIPPTTESVLSGTPGDNEWYRSSVTATLTASDGVGDVSGLSIIRYSWDNVNWYDYDINSKPTKTFDGTYTFYYRAIDNVNNIESISSLTVKIDATEPQPPTLELPEHDTYTNDDTPTLDWSDIIDDVSGLASYEIQVDNNNDFLSVEYSNTLTVAPAVVSALLDGIYYWRVRAKDNAGNVGDWSSVRTIKIDTTGPPVPPLQLPASDIATSTNSMTCAWDNVVDAMSGLKDYIVEIDDDRYFSSIDYLFAVSANIATVTLPDGTYYWRVRARDVLGNLGSWSTPKNLIISHKTLVVYMSNDGGATWEEVENGIEHIFSSVGNDLRSKAILVDANLGVSTISLELKLTYKTISDYDNDGLTNWEEYYVYGTDWEYPDTDDEGLEDGEEVYGEVNGVTFTPTNPNDPDSDHDGLTDYEEVIIYGTDPWDGDTDNDWMPGAWEVKYGLDPLTDDSHDDKDCDGLINVDEYNCSKPPSWNEAIDGIWWNGTDPTYYDTDFDGLNDKEEVLNDLNPTNPDIDDDGIVDGLDIQPTVSWANMYQAPATSYTNFIVDTKLYQADVNYYTNLAQSTPEYIATMIDQSMFTLSETPAGTAKSIHNQESGNQFIVYDTSSALPSNDDVTQGLNTAYEENGFHAVDVSTADTSSTYAGGAGGRSFYTSNFDETLVNYIPIQTHFYHTFLNWTLEPGAKNVITLQFSLDPSSDYSYINAEAYKYRKPGIVFMVYKKDSVSTYSITNAEIDYTAPFINEITNTYTHDDLSLCYRNVSVANNIDTHAFQVDISIPPAYIPSLPEGEFFIVDIMWVWIIQDSGDVSIIPLNPYHYQKCTMDFSYADSSSIDSIMTLYDEYSANKNMRVWPYKYNSATGLLDFTGNMTTNHTMVSTMAWEQYFAGSFGFATPDYFGPALINITASNPSSGLRIGSIIHRVIKDPYLVLSKPGISNETVENDVNTIGDVVTLSTGFYSSGSRTIFLLNTRNAVETDYEMYASIAGGIENADEIIISSDFEDLIYSLLDRPTWGWYDTWSNVVEDTSVTDIYMGNSIFVAKEFLLAYPSITEYKGYGKPSIEINGMLAEGYSWSLKEPYSETAVAKNLTGYSYDLVGKQTTIFEAIITINSEVDPVTLGLTALDYSITITDAVFCSYEKKAVTQRSTSTPGILTGKYTNMGIAIKTAGVVVVIAVTGWEAYAAIQEGDYLKLAVVTSTGALALTGVIWGQEAVGIAGMTVKYAVVVTLVIGVIYVTYYCVLAWQTDDPILKQYYYELAAAAAIDTAVCMIWIGPIPAGIIAELTVYGITWVASAFGLCDHPYSIGNLIVNSYYWLTGQPSAEEQAKQLQEAADWLNNKLEQHAKNGEFTIFIGDLRA